MNEINKMNEINGQQENKKTKAPALGRAPPKKDLPKGYFFIRV